MRLSPLLMLCLRTSPSGVSPRIPLPLVKPVSALRFRGVRPGVVGDGALLRSICQLRLRMRLALLGPLLSLTRR